MEQQPRLPMQEPVAKDAPAETSQFFPPPAASGLGLNVAPPTVVAVALPPVVVAVTLPPVAVAVELPPLFEPRRKNNVRRGSEESAEGGRGGGIGGACDELFSSSGAVGGGIGGACDELFPSSGDNDVVTSVVDAPLSVDNSHAAPSKQSVEMPGVAASPLPPVEEGVGGEEPPSTPVKFDANDFGGGLVLPRMNVRSTPGAVTVTAVTRKPRIPTASGRWSSSTKVVRK